MGLLRQKTIMESFAPCKRTDAIYKQVRAVSGMVNAPEHG